MFMKSKFYYTRILYYNFYTTELSDKISIFCRVICNWSYTNYICIYKYFLIYICINVEVLNTYILVFYILTNITPKIYFSLFLSIPFWRCHKHSNNPKLYTYFICWKMKKYTWWKYVVLSVNIWFFSNIEYYENCIANINSMHIENLVL